MQINVTVQKIHESISYEWDQLPDASKLYLATYGATQALNDAHASVQSKGFDSEAKFLEAVRAKVQARDKQIREGTVAVRGGVTITEAMARRKVAESLGISPEELDRVLEAAGKPSPTKGRKAA